MIMMSGEEGSASHSMISGVNLTNITQGPISIKNPQGGNNNLNLVKQTFLKGFEGDHNTVTSQ